jgi:hypothetical protein
MARLTLSGSLGDQLRITSETVELIDDAGRILGVYTPVRVHVPPAGFRLPLSDEELDRRSQVRQGKSLSDVLSALPK